MDPPSTLLCELRPYQKQALHWMNQLEKGRFLEDAATTLHPCWDAYQLEDKYGFVIKKSILNFLFIKCCLITMIYIQEESYNICECFLWRCSDEFS